MKDTLCIIPARSGSQGIAHKNVQELGEGVSLLEHAVDQGLRTCDRVVVSTDSRTYAEIANQRGATTLQHGRSIGPEEMPEEHERDAIRELLYKGMAKPKLVVRLFCTQPLRSDRDILGAIELATTSNMPVVGASYAGHRDHQLLQRRNGSALYTYRSTQPAVTRDRARANVYANGTVYVSQFESYMENGFWSQPFHVRYVHPLRALDIDEPKDLKLARLLWPIRERLWELGP